MAAVSDDGHKADRCFHRGPIAMPIIARCLGKRCKQKNAWNYAGIGIAMVTLIDSTVSVTTRHSDSAPIASEVGDGVGQSGRSDRRGAAVKAAPCRATVSWS